MASLYVKGKKLWARVKLGKRWIGKPTPFREGEEAKAQRFANEMQRVYDERQAADGKSGERPLTVSEYSKQWIKGRRALGLVSVEADESRLENHVLPVLGRLKLDQVRPKQVRDLVLSLRQARELAPRSIIHVYRTMFSMFRTAVVDERITTSPCVVDAHTLPKKVDKDPEWRATAIYSRTEVERLISATELPPDRRVLYSLQALAGLRHGEAAALRWRQVDPGEEPLGAITLSKTKTGVPRRVPVHPLLAKILATWKLSGWSSVYGRKPNGDDLIVPTPTLSRRAPNSSWLLLQRDLVSLKMRPRRGHDLRRTFITLARTDGARRDLLEAVTHGPKGSIIDLYTSWDWPALCAEVAKLKVTAEVGSLVSLATARATARPSRRGASTSLAERMGFEPMLRTYARRPA